jgi:hypothetical protein
MAEMLPCHCADMVLRLTWCMRRKVDSTGAHETHARIFEQRVRKREKIWAILETSKEDLSISGLGEAIGPPWQDVAKLPILWAAHKGA